MIIDVKVSPKNLLEWSNMEDWDTGTSAAPTEHTLTGTDATIAREATTIKQGTYSAAVTRVGNDATLYHDLPDYADYKGRKMTFGCWVYASVASRGRLSISDAVGSTESSYHTGVAGWEFLTVTRNIDSSATRIRCEMQVNSGNTTVYFDGGILVEGDLSILDLTQYVEDWKLDKKIRMSKYKISRRAGQLITDTEHDEKALSFSGKVSGTTVTTARTAYDSLLKYLNEGEKDLYLHDDRFFRAYLTAENHEYIAASRIIKFNMKFTSQNPFNYFLQKLRNKQTISSSPTTFTLTNNGSAFTKPIVKFVASGNDITTCTLENLTTGQAMSFTGTVLDTKTLIIDCDGVTVENDSVDEIQYFAGDFLRLNSGGNEMKFTGSNCIIKIDYWERYL